MIIIATSNVKKLGGRE